jgi:hypothetical protein
VWSRVLGLGSVVNAGGLIVPLRIFAVKTVSDGEAPQVVLLTALRGFDVRVDVITRFNPYQRLTYRPGYCQYGCVSHQCAHRER